MALDRFPGAAGSDAHLLVVIPRRPAGGEGIAEPVALLEADCVGGVGEGGRALVGGDDEIGIFAVPDDGFRRGHELALHQIVGEAEQRGDELLVGVAAAFEPVRIVPGRELFRIEAAFGADRDDDRVLHLLRLHEAEHFGAVIRRAVRPAQAAARDRAEAQVDAFDLRARHEDFAERLRFRQVGKFAACNLEADPRAHVAVFAGLVEVGALQGAGEAEQAAQDEIVGEAGDAFHRLFEVRGDLLEGLGTGLERFVRLRIKPRSEEIKDEARDGGIAYKGGFLHFLRLIDAALAAIGRERPDQRGLAPAGAGGEDEAVEAVILGLAAPDGDEGVFQRAGQRVQRYGRAIGGVHREGVDPVDVRRIGDRLDWRADGVAGFEVHEEAEILEYRHAARQGDGTVAREDLDADFRGPVRFTAIGAGDNRAAGAERGHAGDIAQRFLGREGFAVGGVECADEGASPFPVSAGEIRLHEQVAEALVPSAGEAGDAGFKLGGFRLGVTGQETDFEMYARHRASIEVGLEGA